MSEKYTAAALPPNIGDPFGGGYFGGKFMLYESVFALVVAPKSGGELIGEPLDPVCPGPFDRFNELIDSYAMNYMGLPSAFVRANSTIDGLANTIALADIERTENITGGPATWAQNLNLGGFDDWYIPSLDELEILYRNLKPTTHKNDTGYDRSGVNPHSVPPSVPYTLENPTQTGAINFMEGNSEAFMDRLYYTSTWCEENSADLAYLWRQFFNDGYQISYSEYFDDEGVRAVRRIRLHES